MKISHTIRGLAIGVALAIAGAALGQSIGYFPPPDWTWVYNGGTALGSASSGVMGAGTLNAQGLFINGNPVAAVGGTQTAHFFYAGPTTGSPATPTFRAIVVADVPTLNQNTTGSAATATTATNIGGGLLNQIAVQSGVGTTTFVAAPTTSGTALEWNGSTFIWATPSGTGCAGANPTATIGLSAVNGSASSCTRSDGAPALSQAISPTWSGSHMFTGAPVTAIASGGVSLGFFGGSAPLVSWVSSGASANNRLWFGAVDGVGDFIIETSDDAVSVQKVAFEATRSASAVATVQIGNATDLPAISLKGNTTVTGQVTASTGFSAPGGISILTANSGVLDFNGGNAAGRLLAVGAITANLANLELAVASSNASVYKDVFLTSVNVGTINGITIGNAADKPVLTMAGSVVISPPASTAAITATVTSSVAAAFTGGNTSTGGAISVTDGHTGAQAWQFGVGITTGSHFQIYDATNGATKFDITNSTGLVTIVGGIHGSHYQFTANVTSGTTSSVACYGGCGSPSVSRSSTGVYVYTHNAGVASLEWTCSVQNGAGGTPGVYPVVASGATTSNAVTIDFLNFTGSLTDPATSTQVTCIASYPT